MVGLADLFDERGGGLLQRAAPMLVALGQHASTPRHRRDGRAMQMGLAAMMQQQQAQQAQAQAEARQQAVQQALAQAGGHLPEGLAGVFGAMDPNDALKAMAGMMAPGKPGDRYRNVPGVGLVDLMGAEGGPSIVPGMEARERDPALEHKIGLMESVGLDREAAINIAAGRYVVSRNPVTEQAEILDKATGQPVGGIPNSTAERVTSADEQDGESLYGRAHQSAGVVPRLEELSTNTLGQLPGALGDAFRFPETVADRQSFRTAVGSMVRSLSVNPKMPVAEIDRIRDQVGIEPSMWESPEGMQARMRSIDKSLRRNIETQKALAADTSMPKDARQSAAANVAAMEAFLSEMGVPQAGQPQAAGQDLPRPQSAEEMRALPRGTVFIAPDGSRRVVP